MTKKIHVRDTTKLSEENILREAFRVTYDTTSLHQLNNIHLGILQKLAPLKTIRP